MKKKKIIIIGSAILALVIMITGIIFSRKTYTLEIVSTPDKAQILINQGITLETPITQKLKAGSYLITATKDGYKVKTQEINLTKNIKIELNLEPLSSLSTNPVSFGNTKPFAAVKPTITGKDFVIAIDRTSEKLIKISKNGITTLFNEPVLYFSLSGDFLSLTGKNNQKELVIININTGLVKKLPAVNNSPIISSSVSQDGEKIAFLGKYDVITRNASLYVSGIGSFSPVEITTTKANKVEYISDDMVLLFETKDALDMSEISLFSLNNKSRVFSLKGNSYNLSPSKDNLLVRTSKNITVYNIETKTKKTRSITSEVNAVWLDNSILVSTRNGANQIEINSLNSSTMETIKSFIFAKGENKVIKKLLGITNNVLYFTTIDGSLDSIDVSQIIPES